HLPRVVEEVGRVLIKTIRQTGAHDRLPRLVVFEDDDLRSHEHTRTWDVSMLRRSPRGGRAKMDCTEIAPPPLQRIGPACNARNACNESSLPGPRPSPRGCRQSNVSTVLPL